MGSSFQVRRSVVTAWPSAPSSSSGRLLPGRFLQMDHMHFVAAREKPNIPDVKSFGMIVKASARFVDACSAPMGGEFPNAVFVRSSSAASGTPATAARRKGRRPVGQFDF
ncbi:MAG: hypothetical protein WKF30_06865 [Pyrinomonadaceae bacterium]